MSSTELHIGYPGLYEALGSAEIRLLHFFPSPEPSSNIYCQLERYSLLDLINPTTFQAFEALSYTWGDPSAVEDIFVNNQGFTVTSNLGAFLRQRREPNSTVTLWIDAVCINQTDFQEKNQQIPMMSMIYAGAARLTIWLGSASEDSHLAIDQLRLLGSGSPYDKMLRLGETQVQQIQRLLKRPWWTRIWIVQELVLGGAFCEFDKIMVFCGPEVLSWPNLVIAAARLKAHEDDQREVLPVISTILELDSLRESARHYLHRPDALVASFDLLCRFRNFLATNPRDKIYAIYNMFSTSPAESLRPRYEAEVYDVYLDFAIATISSEIGLEILRHCGESGPAMPSWVPDWSIPLTCEPLPIRRIPRYFDVPWWAEPKRSISDGENNQWEEPCLSQVTFTSPVYSLDPSIANKERRNRLNRLAIGARGSGQVTSLEEIPSGFTFHRFSDEVKSSLGDLLQNNQILLFVEDERCAKSKLLAGNVAKPAHPVRQGEIITERRTKKWLLRELNHLSCNTTITPPQPNQRKLSFNRDEKTLSLDGVLWDTIEITHDEFVGDVAEDWLNATRFMVAVGSSDTKEDGRRLRYAEWLPEIPFGWTPAPPRTTISNTGHLLVVEGMQILRKQPYDLYHKPFHLPHVVPDPYWEARNQADDLAMRLMRESPLPYIVGPGSSSEEGQKFKFAVVEAERCWRSKLSIVPQGTLDPCIEQFALGRKFFITPKGYFGLGPKNTKPGDRIIALPGSQVPFVMREESTKNFQHAWRLIGESFVHGVMNGEIIAQWKSGVLKSETIVLV
ncbi:heterokaryon incompatibility protein-domain-containing protein [Truncatella angustata]|uniref:Heterokaryon incompatibility protein-domain-containing protein n=1 Tax=Truncatella angustata TaxID=152316 RepID=A0A9P8ZT48_9PEZI|nr:heterokaryon incompatibility protein-domain-containing protein [Truncatella angustata]KAH6648755.1 heterokaryon incompatibility protein-domain-containing protein [Truncatella angustata]